MSDLPFLAKASGGRATTGASFDGIATDSRSVAAGQLFVALRGERFDGHGFVEAALARGAAAAVVDQHWFDGAPEAARAWPLLVVGDTRSALGDIARRWRACFEIPVIGVTGSNGKTTVKEMCAAILRAQAALDGADPATSVLATEGNLNNDIGLPLTVSQMAPQHRFAVIEMGMNRPGEIARLASIAAPTVAVVTNAQRAHLEGMGGIDAVAEEKGAIYGGLRPDGIAVINADDPHADLWRRQSSGFACRSFGVAHAADIHATYILKGHGAELSVHTPAATFELALQVPGRHNVLNALAATAATLAAGAAVEAVRRGLESFRGTKGRLERKAGVNGAVVIDDSYNANPDSLIAGIDVLAATPGRTILVLGDMGEVGSNSAQLHDEVGGYAKSAGVDQLFALGEMSEVAARNFGEGGRHFGRPEDLVSALRNAMNADTVVLVKGSRFMRMERIVDGIVVPKP
ncbi:MAG: UDP-N-acetylmuramoyl-tripeptide--D-alanyl-D-alanine ligase [Rhodocyclaceae bacterium]|nr:UDP-N-acetylmuramoyl-tripeptide--D-alanyl-D-alanine ligase [Rhodocyclaceae bacterium]